MERNWRFYLESAKRWLGWIIPIVLLLWLLWWIRPYYYASKAYYLHYDDAASGGADGLALARIGERGVDAWIWPLSTIDVQHGAWSDGLAAFVDGIKDLGEDEQEQVRELLKAAIQHQDSSLNHLNYNYVLMRIFSDYSQLPALLDSLPLKKRDRLFAASTAYSSHFAERFPEAPRLSRRKEFTMWLEARLQSDGSLVEPSADVPEPVQAQPDEAADGNDSGK